MEYSLFNYSERFAPRGKCVIQATIETDWEHWDSLRKENRERYDAEKRRIADDILTRLDKYYPGIGSQVETTDVATPFTIWRHTRNHNGAWGGWLITPKIITKSMKITLPGLSNFYMAGQWVQPGGSVPGCIYSGRHAIELICRRDKMKLITR